MPDGDRYERGMKTRRQVLGDAHVDRAVGNATPFDEDFQRYITEAAWGDVWSRPGLDHRTRHLVTLAVLAALGRDAELEMHIRSTRNTGVTPDDVKEVVLHVAVYAGVPAANSAFAAAKRVYAQNREEGKQWTSNREHEYSFKTVKPGPVPWQDETTQAPHLNMRVFARGMLLHVITRVYFSDESGNEHDPILSSIADAERRKTLIAAREAVQDAPTYRMDIHLQGDRETVFFSP